MVSGQAQHSSHQLTAIPLEILERPVPLRPGIGRAHDDVHTTSRDAQALYDQGLAYLHSYVWIEAARSFNAALRLDPRLALAHAGLSVALVELNRPADAIAFFERNAQEFPRSSNAFDSLGDGYAASGDKNAAIASYLRSYELDPHNERALNEAARLRGEP